MSLDGQELIRRRQANLCVVCGHSPPMQEEILCESCISNQRAQRRTDAKTERQREADEASANHGDSRAPETAAQRHG